MKTRREPSANYSSVFLNGKTIRIPIDKNKPITELRFPEFYDLAINSVCFGKCPYCYTSATKNGKNFSNIRNKIAEFFGQMTEEQRPYQIAIGGAGESLIHPDFINCIKDLKRYGIVPNYTTNCQHFTEEILDATVEYCGGVAITLHRHLEKFWRKGIELLLNRKIKTNFHIVISDTESIDFFSKIYKEYNGLIDYFVLLPYMNVGFAANNPKVIDYDYLERVMDEIHQYSNIAFGSNFWNWLKKLNKWGVSLYPPEIMSKYLVMDDDMKIYNNSFEMKEIRWDNGVVLPTEEN